MTTSDETRPKRPRRPARTRGEAAEAGLAEFRAGMAGLMGELADAMALAPPMPGEFDERLRAWAGRARDFAEKHGE